MSFKIGIDASRNRSGGAKTHIIGIINELDFEKFNISDIHIWSYSELLNLLPNKKWLIKHSPDQLNKSIFHQLYWQRWILPKELKRFQCNIILNTDGGTLCRFKPSVTISRDMLSYEYGEIDRYKYGRSWLRLIILKYVQNNSFNSANGVIFLSKYASGVIQKSCGQLTNFTVIPHGVGSSFKQFPLKETTFKRGELISCLYVSNISFYKHQWHVVQAIRILFDKGYNIKLTLTGGGSAGSASKAQKKLDKSIKFLDPDNRITKQLGFVPHHTLPVLLAKADIFIFASSCENMPNTLLEAMSVGLPIVCSNRGPMPEVLENGGIYFDPEDPDSIAKSIEKIILNASLRRKSANRAKQLSEQYSWKRCSEETFTFLSEIALKHNT